MLKQQAQINRKDYEHPNLLGFVEYFSDTKLTIVTEYCSGGSLEDEIKRRSANKIPFNDNEIRKFGQQLIKVLFFLHKCGIIYKNVCPQNILLSNAGSLKEIKLLNIYDIGFKERYASKNKNNQIEEAFDIRYVAPEIVINNRPITDKADM